MHQGEERVAPGTRLSSARATPLRPLAAPWGDGLRSLRQIDWHDMQVKGRRIGCSCDGD
jgi:hypothetical protein